MHELIVYPFCVCVVTKRALYASPLWCDTERYVSVLCGLSKIFYGPAQTRGCEPRTCFLG